MARPNDNRPGPRAERGHPARESVQRGMTGALIPWPLAFAFPVDDWQFWAATAVFLLALAWLLRGVLPIPVLSRRRRRRKTQRRATLTIEGKTPER